jgi:hypothetical protein
LGWLTIQQTLEPPSPASKIDQSLLASTRVCPIAGPNAGAAIETARTKAAIVRGMLVMLALTNLAAAYAPPRDRLTRVHQAPGRTIL